MDPFDAVRLLGQLSMAESFIDPDTYSESEHPGSAYVIEIDPVAEIRKARRLVWGDLNPSDPKGDED